MNWEPVGFMFFSTVEIFSWCALSLSIFRFKLKECAWQALFVILLMNLQSYIMRNDLSLDNLAPMLNILFFVLLYATVLKVPILGSLLITISGFIIFAGIQTLLAIMYFGSIEAAKSTLSNGYTLQAMSAIICLPLSWVLYKFGYGFSFDLEKFRSRFETLAVMSTIIFFMIVVTTLLYYNDAWINIAFFLVSLLFFLYYATRRERNY